MLLYFVWRLSYREIPCVICFRSVYRSNNDTIISLLRYTNCSFVPVQISCIDLLLLFLLCLLNAQLHFISVIEEACWMLNTSPKQLGKILIVLRHWRRFTSLSSCGICSWIPTTLRNVCPHMQVKLEFCF